MALLLSFKKLFVQEQKPRKVDDVPVADAASLRKNPNSNKMQAANIYTSEMNCNGENKKSADKLYPELPLRYKLLEVLGEGAFSVVYKGLDIKTDTVVAIKVINKSGLNQKQLNNIKNEILIMKRLNHSNILKLLDAHNSVNDCFLILEYCNGGEIFNKIIEYTYFSEDLSRHVFKQLLTAIDYLHLKNIVHRDIKPENLIFKSIPLKSRPREEFKKKAMRKTDDETKADEGIFQEGVGSGTVGVIKLADFGLAKQLKIESLHKNLKTPCGTAGYTAPEVITCHEVNMNNQKYNFGDKVSKKNYYSKSVDIWSLGCFLYTILCGFPPFYDDNPEQLTMKILKGEYVFLTPWWDEISVEAKDLISKMLVINPEERITTEEIWKHSWIKKMKLCDEKPAEKVKAAVAKGHFPDNYFTNTLSPRQSFEHIEDSITIEQQFERDLLESDELQTCPLISVPKTENLTLLSPRANAIKMVFNNPVIANVANRDSLSLDLDKIVKSSSNVKFTDSNFKKNYISSSEDEDDALPKTPNPMANFKNVFGKVKEDEEDDNMDNGEDDDEEDEAEDEDDVRSLVRRRKKESGLGSKLNNNSDDSLNSADYGKDTRSSSIISGLNGDFKFTLNLNESSLLGRRKSSKSSSNTEAQINNYIAV